MSLKKIILLVIFFIGLLSSAAVFAADYGLDAAAQKAGIGKGQLAISGKTMPQLLGDIIGVALSLIGVIFFVLILYAGILWMTALGSTEKATKAKEILETAAVGLLIVLAAYAVTNFVFKNLGVGEGGGGGGTTISCTGQSDGTKCGDNSECYNSKCISKCEAQLQNGICGSASACTAPNKSTFPGYCPGGTNNVCCADAQ